MALEEYNLKLKSTSSYEELCKLIKDAEKDGYDLYMKKSGYHPFLFTIKDADRVDYLIDDGISTGRSMIKNLHRNMIFR